LNRQSSNKEQHHLFHKKLEVEFHDLEIYIAKSLALLKQSEPKPRERQHQENIQEQEGSDEVLFQNLSITQFLIKHSLFISVYAFMEYSLKGFCEIVASQLGKHERRVSNFEKVHQYYSFLTNEIKLDKRNTDREWTKLDVFRDLRNSIIHYNSTLGKNISTKTYVFIKEDPRIEFEEPRGFRIKDEALIVDLIETSKFFLFALIEEYNQKYFEQN
jgi:hypothetical protein